MNEQVNAFQKKNYFRKQRNISEKYSVQELPEINENMHSSWGCGRAQAGD